ncbi:MAG: Do family serine endopeptidase [Cephaloticoccus sp.]|nr:Do family serine endopeptidase [Cephaloticoccus sp.]MCF7760391.1 Do family serine endopeptidase [Cephaloticoccus sp.]
MKHKLVSGICLTALLGWGATLLVVAQNTTATASKPVLRVDDSAVSKDPSAVVTSYADVLEAVQPAVVSVYSTKIISSRVVDDPIAQLFGGGPGRSRERKEEGLGSGVIVTKDGYIITNNHVVEGADELSVLLPDDREYKATLIGSDPKTDIAVIKIEAENLPVVTLTDSDKLRVGDVVFAVGNPLGVGQTVTMGIVSAKGRNKLGLLENVGGYEDFIQTDAAINMGNSGGALVDAKGRLIGINSAIVSTTKGNIGIGFAIPVNLAASIMHSLIETGTVARGYLGVTSETVTAEFVESLNLPKATKGVAITDITPNGPAAKAGLQRTDVIFGVDERSVSSLEDLRLIIAQSIPGSKVNLHLIRDGKKLSVEVTLGNLAERSNELLAGVEAGPLDAETRRRLGLDSRVTGLVITNVTDDSPYAGYLVPNIVIVEINRTAVLDVVSAKTLFREGRNLLLVYYRGQYRYLTVRVN